MTLIILFFLQVQSNGWLILYGNPNLQFMNTYTTDADTKENKCYYTGTLNGEVDAVFTITYCLI